MLLVQQYEGHFSCKKFASAVFGDFLWLPDLNVIRNVGQLNWNSVAIIVVFVLFLLEYSCVLCFITVTECILVLIVYQKI